MFIYLYLFILCCFIVCIYVYLFVYVYLESSPMIPKVLPDGSMIPRVIIYKIICTISHPYNQTYIHADDHS
jgi:hypothetical protein